MTNPPEDFSAQLRELISNIDRAVGTRLLLYTMQRRRNSLVWRFLLFDGGIREGRFQLYRDRFDRSTAVSGSPASWQSLPAIFAKVIGSTIALPLLSSIPLAIGRSERRSVPGGNGGPRSCAR